MYDPTNPNELENSCQFTEEHNKKNYSLMTLDHFDNVLGNQNKKIGTFIFVIGGTTKQRDFSENYILYPYWDENDSG